MKTKPMVFRLYGDVNDAVMTYLDKLERKSGQRLTVQKLVEQALREFLSRQFIADAKAAYDARRCAPGVWKATIAASRRHK